MSRSSAKVVDGTSTTLEGYADWMQGLVGMMPDASYDLKSWAIDEERNNVSAYAVFFAPWGVSFRETGWSGLVAIALFALPAAVGFLYAWRKGVLRWL